MAYSKLVDAARRGRVEDRARRRLGMAPRLTDDDLERVEESRRPSQLPAMPTAGIHGYSHVPPGR